MSGKRRTNEEEAGGVLRYTDKSDTISVSEIETEMKTRVHMSQFFPSVYSDFELCFSSDLVGYP